MGVASEPTLDFYTWLRRQLILAIASDDELMEQLVLKGGNALHLVHGLGARASIDIDYSIEADLEDPARTGERLFRTLRDRLRPRGLRVFDETFGPRPRNANNLSDPRWGGYRAEFKLIDEPSDQTTGGSLDARRKLARPVLPDMQGKRTFKIEISKYEYCVGRQSVELEGLTFYVYTPAMIAAEKLRAICQQMERPNLSRKRTPRPRDFYDIHVIVTETQLDFRTSGNRVLVAHMFEVKNEPILELAAIETDREFHRQDWGSVQNSVGGMLETFDFYFDFVLGETRKLEPLWVVDTP